MKEYTVVWDTGYVEYQVLHLKLIKMFLGEVDPKGPYTYSAAAQRARDLTDYWRRTGRHRW